MSSGLAQGLRLGALHRFEQRIEQVQRNDDENLGVGVAALELPGTAFCMDLQGIVCGARLHAIRLDVLSQPDSGHGVRVRVDVFDMGLIAEVGVEKCGGDAQLAGRAQSLDEWVCRFDGKIDGLVGGIAVVDDDRQFGEPPDRASIGAL